MRIGYPRVHIGDPHLKERLKGITPVGTKDRGPPLGTFFHQMDVKRRVQTKEQEVWKVRGTRRSFSDPGGGKKTKVQGKL